jgi:2-polyprenyl-3-methyl-5-hydroxy-6-metoxy-1,4-benzoquinol methylase
VSASHPGDANAEGRYAFDRAGEERRLVSQAVYLEPFTERLFRAAGIGAGMRVLDLGSGMGDVALLAGRLVGPEGEVVGVELAAETLEAARRRAAAAGAANVRFVQGDVGALAAGEPFDAAVGRVILMHVPDPAAVLRSAAACLRPGGVLAFHELEFTWFPAIPDWPLWEWMRRLIVGAFAGTGAETQMGLKLSAAFVAAGLPVPALLMDAIVGGGEDFLAYDWAEAAMRGLLPTIERLGLATAEEVEVDTLAARLRSEAVELGAIAICPPFVGAWARTLPS